MDTATSSHAIHHGGTATWLKLKAKSAERLYRCIKKINKEITDGTVYCVYWTVTEAGTNTCEVKWYGSFPVERVKLDKLFQRMGPPGREDWHLHHFVQNPETGSWEAV